MTYELEVLPAAEHENGETIRWLVEHTTPDRAVAYVAAISKALDEFDTVLDLLSYTTFHHRGHCIRPSTAEARLLATAY